MLYLFLITCQPDYDLVLQHGPNVTWYIVSYPTHSENYVLYHIRDYNSVLIGFNPYHTKYKNCSLCSLISKKRSGDTASPPGEVRPPPQTPAEMVQVVQTECVVTCAYKRLRGRKRRVVNGAVVG